MKSDSDIASEINAVVQSELINGNLQAVGIGLLRVLAGVMVLAHPRTEVLAVNIEHARGVLVDFVAQIMQTETAQRYLAEQLAIEAEQRKNLN